MDTPAPRRRWKRPAILMGIGAVLCVGGLAAYLVSFFVLITGLRPSAQTGVPGTMVVETDPGETVTVYVEANVAVAGQIDLDAYPGLVLEAFDVDGNTLPMTSTTVGSVPYTDSSTVTVDIAEVVSPGGIVTINATEVSGAGSVPSSLSAGVEPSVGGTLTFFGIMVVVMLLAIAGCMVFMGGLVWLIVVLATGSSTR